MSFELSDYIISPDGQLVRCCELYHHGIKGMKWGIRRFQRKDGTRTPAGKKRLQETENESDSNRSGKNGSSNSSKRANYKKAAKVGAAVVGTALAAYGTYKLAKFVQDKRSEAAFKKAEDYVEKNFMKKIGETNFAGGKTISTYANKSGTAMEIGARGSKAIGRQNARVMSTANRIYDDATNTRLDRGLSKVVGAGDAVGNAARRAGNAAKRAGSAAGRTSKNAKNRVLDVVNPLYEYSPGETSTTVRNINGLKVTDAVTNYRKRKVRR